MTSLEVLEKNFQEKITHLKGSQSWQQRAWERFLEQGLPGRSNEAYRYLRLRALYEGNYERVEPLLPQLSSLPEGLIALPLSEAWTTYRAYLDRRLSLWLEKEKDPFALINGALCQEGFFIYVPPQMQVELPFTLLYSIVKNQETLLIPRLMVYLGKGAHLKLKITRSGDGSSWINGWSDFSLEEGAQLIVQREEQKSSHTHFEATRVTLKQGACFKNVTLNDAEEGMTRNDYHLQLLGSGSDAKLYGLSRLDKKGQEHTHVLMEHLAPHTTSLQKFKGVVAGNGYSTFEGKIYVHPEAQKTEAYQRNNHLLLSPRAEVKSKPNLEIFADDVKASHGATCGQLDQEALFYLLTRGIDRTSAKNLLVEAFCREVMDEIIA